MTALDVLGYEQPGKLRGERARMIGLVVPEMHNPVFPAFAHAVGGALARLGFATVLCACDVAGPSEADYVRMLLEQHVSGVVFTGGQYAEADAPHDHYQRLAEARVPAVLVNAGMAELDFPDVTTDDVVSVAQALRHLAWLGHERIGLVIGPADHVPSQRKLAAFHQIAGQMGLPHGEEFVEHTLFSVEGGRAAAGRLLSRGITGIVGGSDFIALGAIRAARRAGLTVPGQVSVVGYDDSPLMNCTEPPLTTVRQPIQQMSRAVVAMLLSQIESPVAAQDGLVFQPELVVRGSTGQAALRGPERPPRIEAGFRPRTQASERVRVPPLARTSCGWGGRAGSGRSAQAGPASPPPQ
jgi:DNA-binding LacI/PurR family transcriptional regulator